MSSLWFAALLAEAARSVAVAISLASLALCASQLFLVVAVAAVVVVAVVFVSMLCCNVTTTFRCTVNFSKVVASDRRDDRSGAASRSIAAGSGRGSGKVWSCCIVVVVVAVVHALAVVAVLLLASCS